VLLFDKTGTLTRGRPVLTDVIVAAGRTDADDLLRLAASVDQVSAHVLAGAIVTDARRHRRPATPRRRAAAEIIDVTAIAIALTALLPAHTHTVTMAAADIATARRLYAQHRAVRPVVEQVRGCRHPPRWPRTGPHAPGPARDRPAAARTGRGG
jgi:hypothetical protein